MKSDPMRKLSASLLVLVMVLSTLVILLPSGKVVQGATTNAIDVPVQDTRGFDVSTATVNLVEVHSGAVIQAHLTTPGLYHADGVPAGYYRVDVTAADYYDDSSVYATFDAKSGLVTPTVTLIWPGAKQYQWTVTVTDDDSKSIPSATVGFYNVTEDEIISYDQTNESGVAHVMMFKTPTPTSTEYFILFAKASGYNISYKKITVSSPGTDAFVLPLSKSVSGFVRNYDGTKLLNNVVGYMLNMNTSLPMIARLLKSDAGGNRFQFDAYPGTFILCVAADGGRTYVDDLNVQASGSYTYSDFRLQNKTQRIEQVDLDFATPGNYQSFILGVNTTWSYDDAYPGLKYSDVGCLRLQVDLTGNANGMVDPVEVTNFRDLVNLFGSQYVTSSNLFTLNSTAYDNATSVSGFDMDLASGTSVKDKTGVHYAYSCVYTANAIDIGALDYDSIVSVKYDTAAADYNYTVALVSGYERVSNTSFGGTIAGYSSVAIDPSTGTGSWVTIAMSIEKSEPPSASAGINSEANVAYAVLDSGGNVTGYIVKVGTDVTFNAGSSVDPNGNPLTYTWKFADGTSDVTTLNKTVVHKYLPNLTAPAERTVNLTITDVAGLTNWADLKVICDDREPTPVILAKNRTLNTTDNSVSVNERETLIVNATDSTDDARDLGDGLGLIDWVQFDYGDGNSSNRIAFNATEKNATHSYASAGTYTIVLNVMDVVNHSKNTTLTVKVNDTTKPTVTFTAKNETGGSNLLENRTVVFDASASYDNLDNISLLRFEWNYGDGVWENYTGLAGTNVTHNYTKVATFHVALNVTDLADNWQKTPKTINVLEGPRPKLKVEKVYYSPGNFSEGKQGYILVNLTNTGSRPASGVVVTFWVVRADGTEKLLGTAMSSGGQMYNGSSAVTVVEVGGKVQIKFPVTFNTKGTYTIKVNVTCSDQLTVARYTASGDQVLIVKEAGWKKPLLWGGVAAVIVLVPLALYFRGRLSKREKKGPRREKKSEEA
ncbi:MAG: PKD domain-containing protein, partial [Euryarchaeota archaeon]|nr:PKD domain-containing protein [Euryarchaeota archaeon]